MLRGILSLVFLLLAINLMFRNVATAEQPLPAEDYPVQLRIEDEQKQPVSGAKVWVVTSRPGPTQNSADELSRGVTDQDGRAKVVIPDRWTTIPQILRQEVAFIVYKPGYSLTSLALWRDTTFQKSELVLTLPKSETTQLQIRTPEDQPLTAGRFQALALAVDTLYSDFDEETAAKSARQGVKPRRFSWGYTISKMPVLIPDELRKLFSADIAADGKVTLKDLLPGSLGLFRVETETFGSQTFFRNLFAQMEEETQPYALPTSVRLAKTGRVVVKVTGPPGSEANRRFQLSTRPPKANSPAEDLLIFGFAEVQTDASGIVDVPAIASGQLYWHLLGDATDRFVCDTVPAVRPNVVAGMKTDANIQVKNGISVKGSVLNSVTGKPVSNAAVILLSGMSVEQIETDLQGKFQGVVPPGNLALLVGAPSGYFAPTQNQVARSTALTVPAGKPEYIIPSIRLDPAVVVKGLVTNEQGQPLPGATVHLSSLGRSRRRNESSWAQMSTTTNNLGQFEFANVDPTKSWVWSEQGEAYSEKLITVSPKTFHDLRLSVSPKHTVTFTGRLIDSEGQAVSNGKLELRSRQPMFPESNQSAVPQAVVLKPDSVTFQADGTFRSPPLAPHQEYELTFKSSTRLPKTLSWKLPDRSGELDLGQITLTVVGDVSGLVVDHNGKPVPNAQILSLTFPERRESTTNADGVFRFDSAAKHGFLIVKHPDFRPTGQSLEHLKKGARLELTRHTEQSRQPFTPHLPAISPQDQLKLADQLLQPIFDKKNKFNETAQIRAWQTKASWDPQGVLEHLEKTPAKNSEAAGRVYPALVAALSKRDFEAALEVAESITDERLRMLVLRPLLNHPMVPLQKKRALLAESYVQIKAMKQPELRICYQAQVAEFLWDQGDKARAEELLREGLEIARKLPVSEFAGYARGAFAEELCVLDLPAALDLIHDLKDPSEFDRHHGNIAQELAGRNPAEAQRVLGMLKPIDPNGDRFDARNTSAIPVCYRMATVDLPRAIEIAKSIPDEYARARCFGVIAVALSSSDRATAAQMIENGFLALEESLGKPRHRLSSPYLIGGIAGSLLDTIEKIAPDKLPESLWRTLALLQPVKLDNENRYYTIEEKGQLALFLGMYDVTLAKELLKWIEEANATSNASSRSYLSALAVVDPGAAVTFVEKEANLENSLQNRLTVAKILACQGESRLRLLRQTSFLWNIDIEDLDTD